MFNNPLKKYKQGGQMSTEEAENQMAQALAEAFQMDPQVVKARIQEIRQNPEESKLFAQGLQMLQQGDQQNGMAILGELFKVASHKKGGKIDAFICKHAKGGPVAGCGCNPIKGDNGIPGGMPATDYGYRVINRPNRPALEQLMNEDGSVAATRMINGADTTLTIPSKRGDMPMILSNSLRGANAPGKWMMRRMGAPGVMVAPKGTSKSWNADFDAAKVSVQTEEDGGKVKKAEMGLDGLNDHSPRPAKVDVPLIPGILAELRQRKAANSGNAVNRNFSKANWNGNQYFLERADINGNTVDTWIQVTPDLDTLVQQQLPSGRYTPLTQAQAQSIVNRNRTDINKQEDGGILKGQSGIPEGIPSSGNVDLFGRTIPYSNPVSTQPLDSAKVKLNNGNLIFTDINGNNVSWNDLGNGNWTYRNGNDIMDFSTSQSEGFKPYNRFKAWNRATSGSTKLSEKDNNDLNNLKNKTKNRK